MNSDEKLDALGLLCPLPVLKARKRLISMETNAVLHMITDDPAAIIDVPHFCNEAGHELLKQQKAGDQIIFIIRKVK